MCSGAAGFGLAQPELLQALGQRIGAQELCLLLHNDRNVNQTDMVYSAGGVTFKMLSPE